METILQTADLLEAGVRLNQGDCDGAERLVPALYAFHRCSLLQCGLLRTPIVLDQAVVALLRRWVQFLAEVPDSHRFCIDYNPSERKENNQDTIWGKNEFEWLSEHAPKLHERKPIKVQVYEQDVKRMLAHAQEEWSELLFLGMKPLAVLKLRVGDTADILEVAGLVAQGLIEEAKNVFFAMDTAPRDNLGNFVPGDLLS